MARFLIKTEGLEQRALELRLGVNRVGRNPDGEIYIEHPTISSLHCELALTNDGVYVRDCDSTNGTFVNGERVVEVWLDPGQTLKLGDVEFAGGIHRAPTSPSRSLNVRARLRRRR